MQERGKLIVLEAIDDIWLDQLVGLLCSRLQAWGLTAKKTSEPTYGPAGSQILLAREGRLGFDATSLALLHVADRLDHLERKDGIESSLVAGRHVLCAHFGLATVAALWGQVDRDWLQRVGSLVRRPDLSLFVDLPPKEASRARLRAAYIESIQHMRASGHEIAVIDGSEQLETIQSACERELLGLLGPSMPRQAPEGTI